MMYTTRVNYTRKERSRKKVRMKGEGERQETTRRMVSPAGQFDGGVHRLRPAAREEDTGVRHGSQRGQLATQLIGRLIGEPVEGVKRLERLHLAGHRLDHLSPPVSHRAVPQAGQGVDVLSALVVPDPGPAPSHDPDER